MKLSKVGARISPLKLNLGLLNAFSAASIILSGLPCVAENSSSSINLTFTVPVVCVMVGEVPSCNLELTKVKYNEWVDVVRGYRITLENGFITIETIN